MAFDPIGLFQRTFHLRLQFRQRFAREPRILFQPDVIARLGCSSGQIDGNDLRILHDFVSVAFAHESRYRASTCWPMTMQVSRGGLKSCLRPHWQVTGADCAGADIGLNIGEGDGVHHQMSFTDRA